MGAFDWLKIGGRFKKSTISTFGLGRGRESDGGGIFGLLKVGQGIWVGFFLS